jgi:hypothetical protein
MPTRTKEERALRYSQVADLYLKGWFQADIAKQVHVTQQQVSNDLRTIYRLWKQSAIRDFDTLKERELIKIDKLEQTYWDAWLKSLITYDKSKKKFIKQALHELTKETINQFGEPEYLKGVQWCINKRCQILGIDAPIKINETKELIVFEFGGTGLSIEDFEKKEVEATKLN